MPIFLCIDGKISGPFSGEELAALWQEGDIAGDALYWYEGMRSWLPAAQFRAPPKSLTILPVNVVLSTLPQIAHREILTEREIVTAECVVGVNLFQDFFAGMTDLVGGRSGTMQHALRSARTQCLMEIATEASKCSADAVIGVRLEYSEISGGGKSMLFLVAYGTAVKMAPVMPPIP